MKSFAETLDPSQHHNAIKVLHEHGQLEQQLPISTEILALDGIAKSATLSEMQLAGEDTENFSLAA